MGGKGSFNHEVSKKFIKKHNLKDVEIVFCYTTENVLKSLFEGRIDRGIFGIYNSKSMLVDETVKVMGHYLYDVISYETLLVRHFLMTLPDVNKKDIEVISGHPEAIVQCKKTLEERYKDLKITSGKGDKIDSTAVAQALVSGKVSKNTAVLGSKAIAEAFNLKIQDKDLQDTPDNSTTFLFVRRYK